MALESSGGSSAAGSIMVREAKEDVTLVVPSVNGVERVEQLALKKGSVVSPKQNSAFIFC